MHLSSASPRVGGPRADVGEYGDFMGTLQQISALVVGEMWGLLNVLLSGRMWGLRFCSTERRLGTIDCSLDRWQDGGGEIWNSVQIGHSEIQQGTGASLKL